MVAAGVPPGGSIDETLQRLELREMLIVARRRISGPGWAAFEDVVDYRAALRGLELVEARAMDLDIAELKRVVPGVLRRARHVAGISNLFRNIVSMQAVQSALTAKVAQLQGDVSAEETRLGAVHAAHDEMENRLDELEGKTGLRREQILLRLRLYDILQQDNLRLQAQNAQLYQANTQLSAQHDQLQGQVQQYVSQLERLKGACLAPFDRLLDMLSPEDFLLLDLRRRLKSAGVPYPPLNAATLRVRAVVWAISKGEAVVFDMPRLGPDGGPLRGPDGATLFDKIALVVSCADSDQIQHLIHQASRGAEGPFLVLERIFSVKYCGEPWPPSTTAPGETRRLLDESTSRLDVVCELLMMLRDIVEGKRGRLANLPPSAVSGWTSAPYIEVRTKVEDALREVMKAKWERWRAEDAIGLQESSGTTAESEPSTVVNQEGLNTAWLGPVHIEQVESSRDRSASQPLVNQSNR